MINPIKVDYYYHRYYYLLLLLFTFIILTAAGAVSASAGYHHHKTITTTSPPSLLYYITTNPLPQPPHQHKVSITASRMSSKAATRQRERWTASLVYMVLYHERDFSYRRKTTCGSGFQDSSHNTRGSPLT